MITQFDVSTRGPRTLLDETDWRAVRDAFLRVPGRRILTGPELEVLQYHGLLRLEEGTLVYTDKCRECLEQRELL